MKLRWFLIISSFSLFYAFLGLRLYSIQIEKKDYYFERAQARNEALRLKEIRRGEIYFTDRENNRVPIAQNRDFPIIYAVPKDIENPQKMAEIISAIINQDKDFLINIFSNKKSLFRILVDKASPEEVEKIKSLNFKKEILIDSKQYRFYPFSELASQVLGFVGFNENQNESIGLYGIEKFYNSDLARGKDINLTLDINLQSQAEKILRNLVDKFGAVAGTVIIQEPASGKILALANNPGFNPNNYGKSPIKNFLNPATQSIYEPGSVSKPITMAAGLDSGVFNPDTVFVDTGSVVLNNKIIKNWDNRVYGKITMTQVIENSVNTGAVFAEKLIGHKKFYEYLKKFGFSNKTDIDLPDEINGTLKNLENKYARDIDFATASFGQGIAVTPIRLISTFSAIANNGILMKPFINEEQQPQIIKRVISEEAAQKVILMMESAIEKNKVAVIEGYRVAGKTGTALIPNFEIGGYTEELIHTYVGLAPVSNPRFVILIKVDKPQVGELAALTVVPAFRELMQFALNYYNVPPDKIKSLSQ